MRARVADIYIAKIPSELEIKRLSSEERNIYIDKTENEKAKKDKYFAWRLLEYALRKSFDIEIADLQFEKTESGRWEAEGVEFSISHTDSAVAVAVSDLSVGVDIEAIKKPRSERFAKRLLSEDELSVYEAIEEDKKDEFLLGKWTAREACFKSRHLSYFHPTEPIDSTYNIVTDTVLLGGETYVYSVSSGAGTGVRVFLDIKAEDIII